MQRYFFDISHDGVSVRDEIGVTLPDVGSAQAEAVRVLPEILRGPLADQPRHAFSLDVRDESGAHIFRAAILMVDESTGAGEASGLDDFAVPREG